MNRRSRRGLEEGGRKPTTEERNADHPQERDEGLAALRGYTEEDGDWVLVIWKTP
jgi:hypothetical protein